MRTQGSTISFAAKFLVGLFLSVLVMEAALRLIEITPLWRVLPVVQTQYGRPDPETGYGLRAGVSGIWVKEQRTRLEINEFGMRDRPRTLAKPEGAKRIALMGDSLTEAVQVMQKDTFAARAEAALTTTELPIEVLNLGLSGANPLLQFLRFRSLGERFAPDIAVFVLNVADFSDASFADDRAFPGYIDTVDGNLTIGRRYRERMSQRLLDSMAGSAFFWMVDNFRTANILYTRREMGFDGASPVGVAGRSQKDPCGRLLPYLDVALSLWRDGEPARMRKRLDRYLSDLSQELAKSAVQGIVLWRGLDPSAPSCVSEMDRRQTVVDAIEKVLTSYSLKSFDLDKEVAKHLPPLTDVQRLRGFGSKLGAGHLNEYGHAIYAQVLIDVLRPVLASANSVSR